MKRLGVFTFFDYEGVVDQYLEILLKALCAQCQKLIIVVNGVIRPESLKKLKLYTDDIFLRDNIGYDAGAYKDVFLNHISSSQRKIYDEIVLANDTFYGPLYPLDDIWNKFDNDDADFWGMTRHPSGKWSDGKAFPTHIQSYFIVIRKKMLCSEEFEKFWETMPYPVTIREAIDEFEIKFTTYFSGKGFLGKAFTDLSEQVLLAEAGDNPYLFYSFQLIKDMGVPFFKKKSLHLANPAYSNALNALKYAEETLNYDSQLIWKNIYRLSKENHFSPIINYLRLEEFYQCHRRVFIYGTGCYGKNIAEYFEYKGWINSGFIISDNQLNNNENVSKFNQVKFESQDGIILAVGKKAFCEIYPEIKEKLIPSQMLLLQYTST